MTEATAAHAAAAAEANPTEFPSFFEVFGVDMHGHFLGISMHDWVPIVMSWMVAILLVLVTFLATRKMEKIPRGLQAFMEIVVEGLSNFFTGIIGPSAQRYVPLLGSLFLYIILMNLWGLIPLMHSPTNKLNTTLALAIVVFVTTQYEGRRVGIFQTFPGADGALFSHAAHTSHRGAGTPRFSFSASVWQSNRGRHSYF
jgi:F0F1-type ATP synthase membrane subunit a